MELRKRMMQAVAGWARGWTPPPPHWNKHLAVALVDAITEAARAAVAETVDARDAQACEELAAALRRENPPMYERYVFNQLQLRVDLRRYYAEAVAEEREAWQAAVKRSLRDSEITPMAVMGETTPETAEVMLCQAFHELQRAKRPSALVLADLAEEQGKTEVAEWLRTDWWHIRRICAAAGSREGR